MSSTVQHNMPKCLSQNPIPAALAFLSRQIYRVALDMPPYHWRLEPRLAGISEMSQTESNMMHPGGKRGQGPESDEIRLHLSKRRNPALGSHGQDSGPEKADRAYQLI